MKKLLLLFACLMPCGIQADPVISDSRIKDLPPSVPVRAGYLTIHNPEAETIRIVEVRSDAFASVEIHQTISEDGMMRMEQIPELNIDANATVYLEPGGLHLMMMAPQQPTKPGMVIPLQLILEDGRQIRVDVPVVK